MKYSADSQISDALVSDAYETDISDLNIESKTKHLYKILVDAARHPGGGSGVEQLLRVGCGLFAMDYALLMRRLSQQVAEVTGVTQPPSEEERFFIGQHISIEGTPAAETFDTNAPCIYTKAANMGVSSGSFAYNGVVINTYLGSAVKAASQEPLALCLFSEQGRNAEFTPQDTEIIGLLAEGVACMVDLQKSQAQRKLTDQAMLALGSVKTLDEYMQQARLPEVYGVPARVVEVLERRVGHAPLSIGHVADELNLSKRTLQRRLQQQDISFADLRDQVRFHHSIDYLIKQHMSIDSISASLDFSDRTSFTNAFKRWTGLSPSAFRKLFRDYV